MADDDDLLTRARRLTEPGAAPDPGLAARLAGRADLPAVREAGRILAAADPRLLFPPGHEPRPLRVALVPSFTADQLAAPLRIALLAAGFAPEFHITAPDRQLLLLGGAVDGLDAFGADLTLCPAHEEVLLPRDVDPGDAAALRAAVEERWERFAAAVTAYAARTAGAVLLATVPLPAAALRRIVSHRGRAALARLWRELNLRILDLAERTDRVDVLDLETLLAEHPGPLRDARLHAFAQMAWAPGVEHRYAAEVAGYARALTGRGRKCLVLDLDNTLWGGVLGDDGPENIEIGPLYPGNAYAAVQRTALALRRQGVLLAVASKNDPDLVARVLDEHPELLLRASDFVAIEAGWGAKDDSIRRIAEQLNIGLDAMVFADDSAFECDLVRHALPEVTVIHLAGDPAGHAAALLAEGGFDALTTTDTDKERTGLYRARAQRHRFSAEQPSPEDYLHGLGLRVTLRAADDYTLPRIVQLGGRTNQFNLTGRCHPEDATRRMAHSPDHALLAFEVADRFGDEGIVGALWIARHPDHWVLENAVMSCRVFARGVEHAVLGAVADAARAAGAHRLEADFRATPRNGPAARFLDEAGFAPAAPGASGTARRSLALDPGPRTTAPWITTTVTAPALADSREGHRIP
ncbi:HAD-IIIC family phosphatase [Streptomyces sp. NRRL F-4489]|uniref:HAD-IIIC family phosphatase n=1 Tax=Streptomyces sp. NRRL F-4489 TaxID=1609095 RepID=UPI0008328842|nr:HAD-IIIC family phosphatase [Streptomyces sp. NRRL F-4489]